MRVPQPYLPTPVSIPRRSSTKPWKPPSVLLQRARITNLAVLLLAFIAVLSLLVNIRLYLGDHVFHPPDSPLLEQGIPYSLLSIIPSNLASLNHLVIVAGHAIWKGSNISLIENDNQWFLEDFQKGGSVKTFIKHIEKGVDIALRDPSSLLVFSGGHSRAGVHGSEGNSYLRLAESLHLYDTDSPPSNVTSPPFSRATTELYALDSYQNLLFSISRFKQVTGRYPMYITVVGFAMKKHRFVDLHREAIRWPADRFEYIGIDNDGEDGSGYEGEKVNGLQPFMADMYGCRNFLLNKKKRRNPWRQYHPYHSSSPELASLFEYCPADGSALFSQELPWT